jgi:hypothetical protein
MRRLLAGVLIAGALTALDTIRSVHAQLPPGNTAVPPEQVTVTAQYDRRELRHRIVPHFVEAHTAPTRAIGQIARWQGRGFGRICPSVTGLQQSFGELMEARIQAVGQSIGAPMPAPGQKCAVNIEVVVTSTPQALLDDVAKRYPWELGSNRRAHDTQITRLVQSWYTTGSRQLSETQLPIRGSTRPQVADPMQNQAAVPQGDAPEYAPGVPGEPGLVPDAPYGGAVPMGVAGSRLGIGLRSELVHVLVIVDAQKLLTVPMPALADYIAMVTLTQAPLTDVCNELPSILDLLSAKCGDRPRPTGLTSPDVAFLKALYAASLDKNLNIEQGDVNYRMVDNLMSGR